MNERIKELAEQAGLEWGPGGYADYSDFDHLLFAQLIVKECAEVMQKWKDEPFPFDEDLAATLIKEHFGVEE